MKPIIGHQARWDGLARAFAKGQIPQTLLISGSPNVGKSTFVLRYAQLLLCPELEEDENGLPAPCGVCKTCHQVEIGVHADYRVFRPIVSKTEPITAPETLDSSLIAVSGARDFVEETMRKPLHGPRKVLWMHQFERCQEEAQNAMLKTLEEPPSGAFLVLTTENSRNLRETILSRCWHLPFPRVVESEIESWLYNEFPSSTPQEVLEAVRAGAGRPGAAWRELQRLQESDGTRLSRFAVASEMLKKLDRVSPVAALGLTEEAMKWATVWWEEDAGEGVDLKKLGAKGPRTAAARFLDELMIAGRSMWMQNLDTSEVGAARLDQMRKTRHYILRNANRQLALDVMFGRLIALRPRAATSPVRGR
ncbi:DNA polymerase III subunit delta' [bacterium]|nr:MAG: DNA polymerase III subunit delta' [bacterium]